MKERRRLNTIYDLEKIFGNSEKKRPKEKGRPPKLDVRPFFGYD
jgi:hypothetical protein